MPKSSPIVKRLKAQDQAMLKLLGEYSEQLNRIAEIVYGVKLEVNWVRVIRFSPFSNFALFTGMGLVPKGEKVGEEPLEEDFKISISMTLLLEMLDDESTPYQIADASRAIANVRQVLGAEEFSEFLKDETSDMDKILALLPRFDTPEDREAIHEKIKEDNVEASVTVHTPAILPGKMSGFDISGLTDKQRQSLRLSYSVIVKDNKETN